MLTYRICLHSIGYVTFTTRNSSNYVAFSVKIIRQDMLFKRFIPLNTPKPGYRPYKLSLKKFYSFCDILERYEGKWKYVIL